MLEQSGERIAQNKLYLPGIPTFYEDTDRVKIVRFNSLSETADVLRDIESAKTQFGHNLKNPIIQVRFLMQQQYEQEVHETIKQEYEGTSFQTAGIIGKIPFRDNDQAIGLYYAQLESAGRKGFVEEGTEAVNHMSAVQKGLEKRRRLEKRALNPAFAIEAVSYSTNQYWKVKDDVLEEELNPFYSEDELTVKAIDLHKKSFARAHDNSQREKGGVHSILENNVTLVAYNKDTRDIAALGLLEVDDRFTYADIALIEPTYFTHPAYRQHGLSVHIRQGLQMLVEQSSKTNVYDNKAMIVFNESIRTRSFPLCLQVGCELGGDINSDIQGDLGDAYTYIDDADEKTGLMPMGITFTRDRRLS